jgi:hypothetical protein
VCTCNAGFEGENCATDIDECSDFSEQNSLPAGECYNGAACFESSADPATLPDGWVPVSPDYFRCNCLAGFTGAFSDDYMTVLCEEDVDEC